MTAPAKERTVEDIVRDIEEAVAQLVALVQAGKS